MSLKVAKPTGAALRLAKPTGVRTVVTGRADAALAGFSSLTYGGPFLLPRDGWSYGTPGANPYGVGIKATGFDEPIHNASGSVM